MTERNYTTVNPCVMCQPMGSVMAFKGIENSMVLMHGSQGCSTYMRLHLAHHFREPVDIASTSLSERGAVYGGSENLKKGLKNVMSRYHPKVIGVTTTCLAETIGDDVGRILQEFREEEKDAEDVHIISVSTPSYEESHATGYLRAVEAIVRYFTESGVSKDIFNNKLNVVLGENIAPEDIREIKRILSSNVGPRSFIFTPDTSETFDAPMTGKAEKIFPGGTPLSEIADMKNCAASIGLGITSDNKAIDYLEGKYNVPAKRVPMPIGLEYSDRFMATLSEITGTEVLEMYKKERGRLIDAMVDVHKYLYGTRVAIYGDPEMVLGLLSLSLENGMYPVLVSPSCKTPAFKEHAQERIDRMNLDCDVKILEGLDFDAFNDAVKEANPEMLIGNSNGKYISQQMRIPLMRVGFPIHDRVGAQRILMMGYRGTMSMIDRITNTILEAKDIELEEKWLQKKENNIPGSCCDCTPAHAHLH